MQGRRDKRTFSIIGIVNSGINMWINPRSYELVKTKEAEAFAAKNNLKVCEYETMAGFFNEYVLITIYVEKTEMHADYYDLKNLRWCQELQNLSISEGIIPLEPAKKIYEDCLRTATDSIFTAKEMALYYAYLKLIDLYMQDFLAGDFSRYEPYLKDITSPEQKSRIEAFKLRQFQRK